MLLFPISDQDLQFVMVADLQHLQVVVERRLVDPEARIDRQFACRFERGNQRHDHREVHRQRGNGKDGPAQGLDHAVTLRLRPASQLMP